MRYFDVKWNINLFNDLFISYSNLTSKIDINDATCLNKGHLKYLNKLFYSKNPDECWNIMICLTGFNYLFLCQISNTYSSANKPSCLQLTPGFY